MNKRDRETVDLTGIILAGGRSTRMGFNKAFIEIGGTPLIERIVNLFRELFPEVIIVANDVEGYNNLGVRVLPDVKKGRGSMIGIYSGLIHSAHPRSLVVACDMPFLNRNLLTYMRDEIGEYDVLVPFVEGRYEPLHAVYSKTCIKHMERLINSDKLKIIDLYKEVNVKTIGEETIKRFDPDLLFKTNINTSADLKILQKDLAHKE